MKKTAKTSKKTDKKASVAAAAQPVSLAQVRAMVRTRPTRRAVGVKAEEVGAEVSPKRVGIERRKLTQIKPNDHRIYLYIVIALFV